MKASDDLATNPDSSRLSDIQVLADLGVRVRHIGGYNVYCFIIMARLFWDHSEFRVIAKLLIH